MAEIQGSLLPDIVPDTPLDALPGVKPDRAPELIVAGDLVRVSNSLKVGNFIMNLSAESVPATIAATLLAEMTATLNAAAALAGLAGDTPADLPNLQSPVVVVGKAPSAPAGAPQALPQPPGGVAEAVSPEILENLRQRGVAVPEPVQRPTDDMVQVIPADKLLHMRRADTESGIHRIKVFTKKFSQIGIVAWEEQENEEITHPLESVGIVVGTLQPGQNYKIPAKAKGIRVRFKPAKEAGKRPQPDRVLEFLT